MDRLELHTKKIKIIFMLLLNINAIESDLVLKELETIE